MTPLLRDRSLETEQRIVQETSVIETKLLTPGGVGKQVIDLGRSRMGLASDSDNPSDKSP